MEQYELEAWLGDDDGGLTGRQVLDLLATAQDIETRYPDPDDEDERQAALTVAYQLMVLPEHSVVGPLARKLTQARQDEATALAGLEQAALTLIPSDQHSEAGFARDAGVDRMTVRAWLGKR